MDTNIKDKILKLLALAEGAKGIGSLEEAEVAFAKAQKLLLKHNLSEDELNPIEKSNYTTLKIRIGDYQSKHEGSNFIIVLAAILARLNFSKVVLDRKGKNITDCELILVGKAENLEILREMLGYTTKSLRDIGKSRLKEIGYQGNKNTWMRTFYIGALSGIQSRLKEEIAQMDNTEKGLVLRNDKALENYSNKIFSGGLKTRENQMKVKAGNAGAYYAGVNAGKNHSFSNHKTI